MRALHGAASLNTRLLERQCDGKLIMDVVSGCHIHLWLAVTEERDVAEWHGAALTWRGSWSR
jgi:hypothetical protein